MKSFDSKLNVATSRRALFAPGLLALLTPTFAAKAGKPDTNITVGGLFSFTGNSSDLVNQCSFMMKIASGDAAPLAKEQGVAFELLVEDTQLDPQKAATAAARLIHRGAQFLIGPQTSAEV